VPVGCSCARPTLQLRLHNCCTMKTRSVQAPKPAEISFVEAAARGERGPSDDASLSDLYYFASTTDKVLIGLSFLLFTACGVREPAQTRDLLTLSDLLTRNLLAF
jgi:hypothetical protein